MTIILNDLAITSTTSYLAVAAIWVLSLLSVASFPRPVCTTASSASKYNTNDKSRKLLNRHSFTTLRSKL